MRIYDDKQRINTDDGELVSVNVDATELTAASAEPLRTILSRYGRPVVSKAFADFQLPALSDLSIQFYQMGFALVHCPSWPNGEGHLKFIVSDVMAQDLRDQLEEVEEIETFVIVATSRDYIAVANALRRHDKRVVVIAEESKVCRELRMCADEFIPLPPGRPERASRFARLERVEAPKIERVETPKAERPETVRPERTETPRPERPEAPRIERVEAPKAERVEAPKAERVEPARQERVEAPDAAKLPSDAEVIAEVRKIVAAEGICTPRRLARALCPVDRTATGELRSRIANRIQALIDSGKLQRDKLVVGGTSVETILVGEDRGAKPATPSPEVSSEPQPAGKPARSSRRRKKAEPAPAAAQEPGPMIEGERVDWLDQPAPTSEEDSNGGARFHDLDALVETVLMSPELAAQLLHRGPEKAASADERDRGPEARAEEPSPVDAGPVEPEAAERSMTSEPVAAADAGAWAAPAQPVAEEASHAEVPEPVAAAPEKPKRSRSRRKPAPKPAAEEGGSEQAS
jgi:hypothetical protein